MLQTCVTQKYARMTRSHLIAVCLLRRVPLTKDQSILEPDWEIYLRDTARMIGEQQTPQRYAIARSMNLIRRRRCRFSILEARERLYELIAHCIPAEVIFKVVLVVSRKFSELHRSPRAF